MGLITVVGFRHDLLHEIRENSCDAGVAICEALQTNDQELRETTLWRRGINAQALIFTPTIHTGDEHWYRASGNTLQEVKKGKATYVIQWSIPGIPGLDRWTDYKEHTSFEAASLEMTALAVQASRVSESNPPGATYRLITVEVVLGG